MDDADLAPLADLQAAYLAASQASMDATLDASAIQDEPASANQADRFLTALRGMVELQAEALAAHDRLSRRVAQLEADRKIIDQLRGGRVELAVVLQRTIEQVRRLELR